MARDASSLATAPLRARSDGAIGRSCWLPLGATPASSSVLGSVPAGRCFARGMLFQKRARIIGTTRRSGGRS